MARQLKIEIELDRSKAKEQSEQFKEDQKKLGAELLTDAQKQERAQQDMATRTSQVRKRAALDSKSTAVAAIEAETAAARSSFNAIAGAATAAGKQGKASFADMAIGIGALGTAATAVIATVRGLATEIDKAGKKSREMAAGFVGKRESLAELASLKGQQADNKFTIDQAEFNKRTGLTHEESVRGQTEFMNTAAQHIGDDPGKVSQTIADKMMEGAAKIALGRQIDPGVVMGLAGKMLGAKDYSKMGDQASDTLLGDLNQNLAVLSGGSGDNAQLVSETSKLMASSQNEDETKGVFKDTKDVSKLISVMTEGFPMGQAEAGQALLRGIRGFNKEQKTFLKEAGVTLEDTPFDAIEKIGKLAQAKAAKGKPGTKVQDVIKGVFPDELENRAISVAINTGVSGGAFANREAVAQANAGPAPALAQVADYEASERGQQRMADAGAELEMAKQGAKNSQLNILRKQALAKLIRDKAINTNATNINDYLNQKASFGMIGEAEQKRIDDEAQRMANARAPVGTEPGPLSDLLNFSPTAREEDLNRRMERVRAAGGDPLRDRGAAEDELVRARRDRLAPALAGAVDAAYGVDNGQFSPALPTLPGFRPPQTPAMEAKPGEVAVKWNIAGNRGAGAAGAGADPMTKEQGDKMTQLLERQVRIMEEKGPEQPIPRRIVPANQAPPVQKRN